ncbi:MAG: DNA repair protein RecO [Clostridia bacterium]|nr:DNA repair protein RecO [Clostridia bacterium]
MPAITTRGIVLRYANYRDHDRMLTLLTPGYGRVDVLSRGCRRPKSALMPASELFVTGEFVVFMQNEHATLTSCTLDDTFYPLRLDPYRLTCASYMTALCAAAVQPGENAASLYALLLKGLYYLAYDNEADALETTTAFLLLFADANGYRPRLSRCAHCRTPLDLTNGAPFDVAAGGLCCPDCASRATYCMTLDAIKWMSETIRNGLTPQKNTGAGTLFDVLRRYVESRLETPIKVSKLLP